MAAQALTEFFAAPEVSRDYSVFEQITGTPAVQLLQQAGLLPPPEAASSPSPSPFLSPVRLLDNAGGTGVLSALLLEGVSGRGHSVEVVCGDLSRSMLAAAEKRFKARGWKVETMVVDGQAMKFPDGQFTHVLTNFGFQSFPDPERGIKESIRVTAPGGTVGMTFWTLAGWAPAFRRALSQIPGARDPSLVPDAFRATPEHAVWDHDPNAVKVRMEALGGVEAVEVEPFEFTLTPNAGEEEAAGLKGLFGAVMSGWSEAERAACLEGGRLEKELAKAIDEGGPQVWKSLIVTCRKKQ